MSRKPESFDEFMRGVEEETRVAGPKAQAEADAIRDHFRLAAQVLRRRRELGLTQAQLAGLVGVHQSEISKIERGAGSPGYRMLTKLAEGLQSELALVPRTPVAARSPRFSQKKASKSGTGSRRAARAPAVARAVRTRPGR